MDLKGGLNCPTMAPGGTPGDPLMSQSVGPDQLKADPTVHPVEALKLLIPSWLTRPPDR